MHNFGLGLISAYSGFENSQQVASTKSSRGMYVTTVLMARLFPLKKNWEDGSQQLYSRGGLSWFIFILFQWQQVLRARGQVIKLTKLFRVRFLSKPEIS